MKRSALLVAVAVAVAFLVSASFAPTAVALPRDSVYIAYYDCEFNLIGEYYRSCYSGGSFYWGSQSGAFKYEETESCSGLNDPSATWFVWSNGAWQYSATQPTACARDQVVDYYSCWEWYVGTHHVACDGTVTDTGTVTGNYKHVVDRSCADNSVISDQWYARDSQGNWVPWTPPNVYEC